MHINKEKCNSKDEKCMWNKNNAHQKKNMFTATNQTIEVQKITSPFQD